MDLVILDRDGVINEDRADFVRSPGQWVPVPGSLEAIARLCAAGVRVAVATNQSGIGRGLYDEAALAAIHRRMRSEIIKYGGDLDAIVYCPHHPDDDCDCRKPRAGLLQQLAASYDRSLTGVPCIGDAQRDLEAAAAVGARPILVLTGKGRATLEALGDPAPEYYSNLSTAVDRLLGEDPP
jgi:D-glycero-D-manno-heptose 1,7-bisphosphate phosphatase